MNKASVKPSSLYDYYWSSDIAIHPNNKDIAYVLKQINSEKDNYTSYIRVVNIDGTEDVSLTSGKHDSMPNWSPSGDKLAFLRITDGLNQLWYIDDKQTEQQLTHVKQSISEYQWLPDSSGIIFVAKANLAEATQITRKREISSYTVNMPKAEGSGWWDGQYAQMFRYQFSDGTVEPLVKGNYQASQVRIWGNYIAFLASSKKGDDSNQSLNGLYVIDETGRIDNIVNDQYEISSYTWSEDGESILFLGHDRKYGIGATQNKLYKVDVKSKIVVPVSHEDIQLGVYVLNDMLAGKSEAGPISTSFETESGLKGNVYYALASQHGHTQIWQWQDEQGGRQLTEESWVINQQYVSADKQKFIVNASYSHSPAELYTIDRETGSIAPITAWNKAFCEQHSVSIAQSFTFKNDKGDDIESWILLPEAKTTKGSVPLVLNIHGGPHAMYSSAYSHEFQCIVAQGFALLYCNPRGSFGYGQSFATDCLNDFGNGDYEDIMRAVDIALQNYPQLSSERMGVMGGSYGGLMTNWIVGQTDRFAVAISQRSISNWLSFYGTSDIGTRYTEAMVGSNPWENSSLLWHRSPIAYANNVNTPILIMHGEQDMRCPIGQSDEWYVCLKHLGKTAKLVRYAASNHAFQKAGKPSMRIDVLEQVNHWLQQYLNKPITLGIPFAMLLENCRSSGVADEDIAHCFEQKDFTSIAEHVKEKDMPFLERLETAEQLGINWNDVFKYGYTFSFLHTNALKRLLNFRYSLVEGEHYREVNYELHDVQLTEVQASELLNLIHVQWEITLGLEGYVIARKKIE